MAVVAISPILERNRTMSNRRIPLANNPNAANSPYRALTAAAVKRPRFETEKQDDLLYDQQPPSKRQAVEIVQTRPRTPTRKQAVLHPEGRIFNRKTTTSQPTDFERKLYAAKDKQTQQRVERQEKAAAESLDGIKQWQRYYRRVFPEYVFYFENIPADVRAKSLKQIRALGAREEKFFSKDVTHVVTTRSLPAETDLISPIDSVRPSVATTNSQTISQLRSTNPRAGDYGQPPQMRSKLTFETTLGRKPVLSGFRDVEPRKPNVSNTDFLSRAREMGMKIWQLEKLQRVLSTMFDPPNESQAQCGRAMANQPIPKGEKEADLSRMLRNERLNGPSDRDTTVTLVEMVPFKGPHIYIRDMDEKTKPILVKEYPKVARSEKGDWPQFRCVSAGKCPFVEEVDPGRLDSDRVQTRGEQAVTYADTRSAPKPRATTAVKKPVERPSTNLSNTRQRQPLGEPRWGPNSAIPVGDKKPDETICAPPPATKRGRSPVKGMKSVSAIAGPRLFCGEPAASGLQPSNVTSAIRSQVISSTAAVPGAKTGTSREFQELKRKVLERNSGVVSNLQAPRRLNEASTVTRAGNSIALAKKATSRTHEILDLINEGQSQSEDEDYWVDDQAKRVRRMAERIEMKESKPGYCENCRDKYNDFDVHIFGRKHRKFAHAPENWKDLDELLVHLRRPLKEDESDEF